jgi:hypothetical protein
MVCLIVCILISAALFSSLVLFVVVVAAAALFVFGGLHFDLVLGLTRAFLAFLYFL